MTADCVAVSAGLQQLKVCLVSHDSAHIYFQLHLYPAGDAKMGNDSCGLVLGQVRYGFFSHDNDAIRLN
jgi:hypothetical protein